MVHHIVEQLCVVVLRCDVYSLKGNEFVVVTHTGFSFIGFVTRNNQAVLAIILNNERLFRNEGSCLDILVAYSVALVTWEATLATNIEYTHATTVHEHCFNIAVEPLFLFVVIKDTLDDRVAEVATLIFAQCQALLN